MAKIQTKSFHFYRLKFRYLFSTNQCQSYVKALHLLAKGLLLFFHHALGLTQLCFSFYYKKDTIIQFMIFGEQKLASLNFKEKFDFGLTVSKQDPIVQNCMILFIKSIILFYLIFSTLLQNCRKGI